jgi:tripartite-type tricarboxylate transporter receptor subunit TctC
VVASTYAKQPYDPQDDMTGIALLAHIPFVVGASPKYKTLADLDARRCSGHSPPQPRSGPSL